MPARTETEARTKLCPLVKSKIGSASPEEHTNCIASDCMAWRWWGDRKLMEVGQPEPEIGEQIGYCGAFGVPAAIPHDSKPPIKLG